MTRKSCKLDIPGHTQPKKILSGTIYLDENVLAKYVRYQLIPFRRTDDQRILHSDLTRSTPGHIQMKKLVLDATIH